MEERQEPSKSEIISIRLSAAFVALLFCLSILLPHPAFASSLQDFPKTTDKVVNAPTEATQEYVRKKLAEIEARHKAYENYVYSDEQRATVIQLLTDAMTVLRGQEDYSAITRRYKIWGQTENIGDWREYRGGYRDNLEVINDWTSVYFTLTEGESGKPEPYRFFIYFMPEMKGISRSQIEDLLQLKVVRGWTNEGGNMQRPGFDLHSGIQTRNAVFDYSPHHQPDGDYTIEVSLKFYDSIDASLEGLYAAGNHLGSIEILREYLTPIEKLKRSRERVGNLPHTGEPVPETARYEPVFDDEKLQARAARYPVRSWEFKAGEKFGSAWLHAPDGEQMPFPAFWRKSIN